MLFLLFVLSLAAAPVEYLAHEGAHYIAARLMGAHATLHFDRVTLEAGARLGDTQRLLFAGAGPVVDWAVGMTALAMLVRGFTPIRLVLAIWVARPLQFVPAVLGIDLSAFGISASLDGTDEASLGGAMGMSPATVVWVELAAAMPLLALIVICIPGSLRPAVLATLCTGVLAGWVGWLAWGPMILP